MKSLVIPCPIVKISKIQPPPSCVVVFAVVIGQRSYSERQVPMHTTSEFKFLSLPDWNRLKGICTINVLHFNSRLFYFSPVSFVICYWIAVFLFPLQLLSCSNKLIFSSLGITNVLSCLVSLTLLYNVLHPQLSVEHVIMIFQILCRVKRQKELCMKKYQRSIDKNKYERHHKMFWTSVIFILFLFFYYMEPQPWFWPVTHWTF